MSTEWTIAMDSFRKLLKTFLFS